MERVATVTYSSEDKISLPQLILQIKEDWAHNGRDWTKPGFRAIAIHRYGQWVWGIRSRIARALPKRIYYMLFRFVRNHYGIEIDRAAKIGRRVKIAHQSGIHIHPKAIVGDFCLIRQNVTIGGASNKRADLAPKLGNRVHIGSGAQILGNVTIGDRVKIGANAVITTNIPAHSIVFVPPPKVLKMISLK